MDSQFAPTEVAVVGGGLAGLSAAAYLARAGVAVTLFEKAAGPGGRAATQQVAGYSFNRGAHALYVGGAATRVLRELGVPCPGRAPTGILALRGGAFHPLPAGPASLWRSDLLDGADKREFIRLAAGLLARPARALRPVSIQAWLDTRVRRPRVRQMLAAIARTFTYSAALDQISAEVFATQMLLSLKHPVRYIDGGWQTLVAGLRRVAVEAGAHLASEAQVAGLVHEDGRVQGVRLDDGTSVRAAAVLLATAAGDALRLLDDGVAPALQRVVAAGGAVQVACLDVALRRLPTPQRPVVFDLDGPRFLTVQSAFARIAPAGGALISTLKYLDPAQPTDPRDDERSLEDLLDIVQPGWRAELLKRIYLPRIEAVSLRPAPGPGFAGRPGPRVPEAPGLYLAGDWVGAEGYLTDASLASARQAAHLLLGGDLARLRAAAGRIPVGAVQ